MALEVEGTNNPEGETGTGSRLASRARGEFPGVTGGLCRGRVKS